MSPVALDVPAITSSANECLALAASTARNIRQSLLWVLRLRQSEPCIVLLPESLIVNDLVPFAICRLLALNSD